MECLFSVTRKDSTRAILSFDLATMSLREVKQERITKSTKFAQIEKCESSTANATAFRISYRDKRPVDDYLALSETERNHIIGIFAELLQTGTISEQNIQRFSPSRWQKPMKQGWIEKKGKLKYSRRWLVVGSGMLFCFKTDTSQLPLNSMPLANVNTTLSNAIVTVHMSPRPFVFRAKSGNEAMEWCAALNRMSQAELPSFVTPSVVSIAPGSTFGFGDELMTPFQPAVRTSVPVQSSATSGSLMAPPMHSHIPRSASWNAPLSHAAEERVDVYMGLDKLQQFDDSARAESMGFDASSFHLMHTSLAHEIRARMQVGARAAQQQLSSLKDILLAPKACRLTLRTYSAHDITLDPPGQAPSANVAPIARPAASAPVVDLLTYSQPPPVAAPAKPVIKASPWAKATASDDLMSAFGYVTNAASGKSRFPLNERMNGCQISLSMDGTELVVQTTSEAAPLIVKQLVGVRMHCFNDSIAVVELSDNTVLEVDFPGTSARQWAAALLQVILFHRGDRAETVIHCVQLQREQAAERLSFVLQAKSLPLPVAETGSFVSIPSATPSEADATAATGSVVEFDPFTQPQTAPHTVPAPVEFDPFTQQGQGAW